MCLMERFPRVAVAAVRPLADPSGLAQSLLSRRIGAARHIPQLRHTPGGTMNPKPWPPHRILVPVDFSEHSEHALSYAVGLAEAVGASIWALHVGATVPPIYSPLPESTAAQAQIWSDMLARREQIQRDEVAKAVAPFADREVAIEILWAEGEPASSISATAESLDVDLVIMGSHGRTGLKRALLGSVAERTVRLLGRPVLVLR